MFTFGIFSTHLPYLFMVFFYAVFLLFGNGKPISDAAFDLKFKDTEVHTISIIALQDPENDYSVDCSSGTTYIDRCCALKLAPLYTALFDKESLSESGIYSYNLFSRPPPSC